MEQNIKNFIEEGENLKEEFVELYDNNDIPVDKDIVNRPDRIADWWLDKFSSRQISLIKMKDQEFQDKLKMIVEMCGNLETNWEANNKEHDLIRKGYYLALDTITSKLTNIIKE